MPSFFFFGYVACEILVPWPGIEPILSAVEAQSLLHWNAREVPPSCFNITQHMFF